MGVVSSNTHTGRGPHHSSRRALIQAGWSHALNSETHRPGKVSPASAVPTTELCSSVHLLQGSQTLVLMSAYLSSRCLAISLKQSGLSALTNHGSFRVP